MSYNAVSLNATGEAGDQGNRTPILISGRLNTVLPAGVKAANSSAYTLPISITIRYNGHNLHFRNGPGYILDSALVTALTNAGATPTAL